jgi:hypothetical protein
MWSVPKASPTFAASPGVEQAPGDHQADAAAAAGDQGGLAGQSKRLMVADSTRPRGVGERAPWREH